MTRIGAFGIPINPFTKLCDNSWNNISIKIFESERLFIETNKISSY